MARGCQVEYLERISEESWKRRHEQCIEMRLRHRFEGLLVAVATPSNRDNVKLDADGAGDTLHFRKGEARPRIEHTDFPGFGHGFQQKLQSFRVQFGSKHVNARNVTAGMGEVGDNPRFDQATRPPKCHDDRDGVRRLSRCANCRRTDCDDNVHFGTNQLGGKAR